MKKWRLQLCLNSNNTNYSFSSFVNTSLYTLSIWFLWLFKYKKCSCKNLSQKLFFFIFFSSRCLFPSFLCIFLFLKIIHITPMPWVYCFLVIQYAVMTITRNSRGTTSPLCSNWKSLSFDWLQWTMYKRIYGQSCYEIFLHHRRDLLWKDSLQTNREYLGIFFHQQLSLDSPLW